MCQDDVIRGLLASTIEDARGWDGASIAALCHRQPSDVSKWVNGTQAIPAYAVGRICKATGDPRMMAHLNRASGFEDHAAAMEIAIANRARMMRDVALGLADNDWEMAEALAVVRERREGGS